MYNLQYFIVNNLSITSIENKLYKAHLMHKNLKMSVPLSARAMKISFFALSNL